MKGGYYLFHALAFWQFYNLSKKQKNQTQDDLKVKATYLALSVLSIPRNSSENELSPENYTKFTEMISQTSIPNKTELQRSLLNGFTIQTARKDAQRLCQMLDSDFDVLNFAEEAYGICQDLSKEPKLAQLIPHLEQSLIEKLIENLSLVYSSITFEKFKKYLFKFDFRRSQEIILNSGKELKVSMNYEQGLITFGESSSDYNVLLQSVILLDQEVYEVLTEVTYSSAEAIERQQRELEAAAKDYIKNKSKIIEERKSLMKEFDKMREPEEFETLKKAQESENKAKNEEEKRVFEQMEKERKAEEKRVKGETFELKMKRNIVDALGQDKVKLNNKRVDLLTNEELMSIPLDSLEKLRHETARLKNEKAEKNLENNLKRHIYEEKAIDEVALPLIEKVIEEDVSKFNVKEVVAQCKTLHEKRLGLKAPLSKGLGFQQEFLRKQKEKAEKEYNQKLAEFKERLTKNYKAVIEEKAINQLKAEKELV